MRPLDYRRSHLHKGADYDVDLMSDAVSSYMDEREKSVLFDFLKMTFPNGVDRYLDFACGTGRITEVVAGRAREAIGVDVSHSMVSQARNRCKSVRFVVADITRESHELAGFDLVTAFRFLGNAQDELRESALRQIFRLLKPKGYLVLNNHRNPWAPLSLVRRCTGGPLDMDLSHSKLRRLLFNAGFRLVSTRGIGGWWVPCQKVTGAQAPSSLARVVDRALGIPLLAPICADAVLVAQKPSA